MILKNISKSKIRIQYSESLKNRIYIKKLNNNIIIKNQSEIMELKPTVRDFKYCWKALKDAKGYCKTLINK